jgi:hypothetical protein
MRGRKPSPAMIVACLALFVALGGTGIAASRYIITSTRQIRPRVLKALRGNTGPRGPVGPAGPAGPRGPAGFPGPGVTPSPAEVTFFSGSIANNQQSQVFAASGYTSLRLTSECSKPATLVVEVGNGSAWVGTETVSCSHPGFVRELAVNGAFYRVMLWTAEGPLLVTAIARFS